jgi:hypothetical protein
VAVAAGTRTDVGEELVRLEADVLPRWEVPRGLLAGLDSVPGVLQHNDLGTWNIVSRRDDFCVVDWESARTSGLPLWDLWYFLADALRLVDDPSEEPQQAFRRLFRGEARLSGTLFEWTRRATSALAVPDELVGPIATLCWLHHGLSHRARVAALAASGMEASVRTWPPVDYPRTWLDDPLLGSTWPAWRTWSSVRSGAR